MRHTRLDTLLLAGIGSLTVHELAYLPESVGASMGSSVAHANLSVLWGVGGVLAALALARLVVRNLRSRAGARTIDARMLAMQMLGLFVLQEVIERALADQPPSALAGEVVLWLAVVVTPLVAVALARLTQTAVDIIARRVATALRPGSTGVALVRCTGRAALRSQWLGQLFRSRGPPLPIVSA